MMGTELDHAIENFKHRWEMHKHANPDPDSDQRRPGMSTAKSLQPAHANSLFAAAQPGQQRFGYDRRRQDQSAGALPLPLYTPGMPPSALLHAPSLPPGLRPLC